jgi:hypothetical protein
MSATIVRYRVKPGRAEENAELVRAVYAELASVQPPGFRYATFQDDLTFTHVAFGEYPLSTLEAFQRFQAGIAERCDEPPRVLRGAVASYGLTAPSAADAPAAP